MFASFCKQAMTDETAIGERQKKNAEIRKRIDERKALLREHTKHKVPPSNIINAIGANCEHCLLHMLTPETLDDYMSRYADEEEDGSFSVSGYKDYFFMYKNDFVRMPYGQYPLYTPSMFAANNNRPELLAHLLDIGADSEAYAVGENAQLLDFITTRMDTNSEKTRAIMQKHYAQAIGIGIDSSQTSGLEERVRILENKVKTLDEVTMIEAQSEIQKLRLDIAKDDSKLVPRIAKIESMIVEQQKINEEKIAKLLKDINAKLGESKTTLDKNLEELDELDTKVDQIEAYAERVDERLNMIDDTHNQKEAEIEEKLGAIKDQNTILINESVQQIKEDAEAYLKAQITDSKKTIERKVEERISVNNKAIDRALSLTKKSIDLGVEKKLSDNNQEMDRLKAENRLIVKEISDVKSAIEEEIEKTADETTSIRRDISNISKSMDEIKDEIEGISHIIMHVQPQQPEPQPQPETELEPELEPEPQPQTHQGEQILKGKKKKGNNNDY